MEADWDEIVRIAVPTAGPLALPSPASSIAFDDSQELLWIGTDQLQKYTSIRAHLQEGAVRQLLVCEKGVLSISNQSVHLINRRALTQWHLSDPSMTELRCMAFTATPNLLMVAGCQPTFYLIDIEKGTIVSIHPAQAKYTILKKCRHICAATDDGMIHVLDVHNYSLLQTWKAHSGAVNDMDARHDYLVTCGLSFRQMGPPMVDPLANVYDLKSLKPLPPIPFHAGAAYVRLHPKLSTTSFVASNTGQMQVVDLMNPVNVMLRQANVQFMLGMEIASSGDALVVNDLSGWLYLWGSPVKVRFNNVSKETEFGQPPPRNLPSIDWQDQPLNTIGMPYYPDRLLSAWPSHMTFDVSASPTCLDPAATAYMQPAELGYYGPWQNPSKLRRYQVQNTRSDHGPTTIAAPKFLSEKAREFPEADPLAQADGAIAAMAGLLLNGRAQTEKERMLKYSNVEIKYSRFGVDDFDFQFYNKTDYSGLETHIKNSYLNALLQLYKFVPLIRNVAIQHAATACVKPNCMLCEFGFLFDMLEKAGGQNCQATNLLHAFGSLSEARSLNLLENAALANHVTLSNTIQSVNRFLLKQISHDYASMAGSSDGIDEVLSTGALEAIRCLHCGNVTTKHGSLYVHDMLYPNIDPKHNPRSHMFKFSSILKATMEREVKHRGFCNKCRRYQQLATRKSIQHLPFVLMLNTALTNPAMHTLWENPGWLPTEVGVMMQNRGIYVFEGTELQTQLRNKASSIIVYELVGFVADIDTTERQQPHLVSLVNVDVSSRKDSPKNKWSTDWHLFNDFLVSPVESREAVCFDRAWKMPSILAYQVKSAHGRVDERWKENMDISLLYSPYTINGVAGTPECELLEDNERPAPGMPIALDTEFVELERAEIDVKADGTQETIRPAKNGLARVSVLRGNGMQEGKPFVDDYITIFDTIVDYKTQYSGIKPGDLDVRMSRHNLVPLKVAYKKLWLLLNLGCIFVGHGLASDFRKANIHVPRSQTVDTQNLYLLPGKNRRFSLKYLAWAVFKEYIQEDPEDMSQIDGHDSIEDARMALRLWRKFQEFEDAGIVEQMVEDIYRKGSRFGWKPPNKSAVMSIEGGALTTSAVPSGRNTPDMSLNGGIPATPARSIIGSPNYKSNGMLTPGSALIKESPLR
ncbi:poly(A)-specific ribonuclease [Lithohypha guttulata]|uniref:PAN2-PAN3 deadenylation complex catalytic subunit PAN2 n=1 Tax=Lithohypha guttulata TaxID=1690604 RepID=A0AAN7SWZ4_9EURO|nr:poly(A)-specific ribonuclease [Lithohypha guttulata]